MTGRIGNIELASGVRVMHFWTYMYASLICIGMISNMNFSQPYILMEHLGIPDEFTGRITGQLTLITEVMNLLLIWPFGILADRIGRRPVIMLGIGTIGLSYALYPWATEVNHLWAIRVIFGIGVAAAAAMTATIQNDYPVESSRGRVVGFSSAFNALGIVFATWMVSRLPVWLQDAGMEPVAAGRYAYSAAAIVCFVSILIFRFGLKAGVPEHTRQRPRWWDLIRTGIEQMRNPRIVLAYVYAMPARGALVVFGLFTSLWASTAFRAAGGEVAVAQYQVWLPSTVGTLTAVGWSFVFGWILDRISRVAGVVLSAAISMVAYGSMYFVETPLDLRMLPLFALVGASMAGGMMSSMALVGQEAPPAKRGAVIGLLSLFGSAGIMLAATYGGELFSLATPWAPYLLIAGAQAVVFVFAVIVWVVAPGDWKPGSAAAMGRH
ncbi:MAG: MFS transporter [Gammaproteobacteria bacterium]|nr:MFS transporter [Gammaproteobacteria bacterium]MDE0415262.1 MFS transporter [Gammaproteobacteria bacterium]